MCQRRCSVDVASPDDRGLLAPSRRSFLRAAAGATFLAGACEGKLPGSSGAGTVSHDGAAGGEPDAGRPGTTRPDAGAAGSTGPDASGPGSSVMDAASAGQGQDAGAPEMQKDTRPAPVTGADGPISLPNVDLADVPDNTWVELAAKVPADKMGGAEVFWGYDPKNRLFLHYGGCTSPYTNEAWTFSLGAKLWTRIHPHDLTDGGRPGSGCSRGLCFDSRRGLIWINGGAANDPGAGSLGLWSYDAASKRWTEAPWNWGSPTARYDSTSPQGANSLGYDSANDLLVSV